MNFYQEELLEHYKYPYNNKCLDHADFSTQKANPSCGDEMQIQGSIKNNVVVDLGFQGKGCVISQATASMLTQECIGKSVQEILSLTKDDILSLVGLKLGPVRVKCALLSLQVLQEGLSSLPRN